MPLVEREFPLRTVASESAGNVRDDTDTRGRNCREKPESIDETKFAASVVT